MDTQESLRDAQATAASVIAPSKSRANGSASFAVFFLALSVAFSALATLPRTSGPKGSLIFFGGIESLEADQYAKSMKALAQDEYVDDLITQCHRNAQIAVKKYNWVQRSMGCLFLSAAPWAVALFSLYVAK